MFERYVSNRVLNAIIRPQAYKMCSIYCIIEAYHIIKKGHITPKEVLQKANISYDTVTGGKIGNTQMIEISRSLGLSMIATKTVEWDKLKELIKKSVIIYHMVGHYCLIAGYIEEPTILNSGDQVKFNQNVQRWVVLADHRVKGKTDHNSGMLMMIKFDEMLQTLRDHGNTALLFVT